jgi:hypothetical protein
MLTTNAGQRIGNNIARVTVLRRNLACCRLTKLTSLHRTVETVPCQN